MKHRNSRKGYATSGHQIELQIEGNVTAVQRSALACTFHDACCTFYGSDIKKYLTSNLKGYFEKTGAGGSHVWASDSSNNRIAIIYIR